MNEKSTGKEIVLPQMNKFLGDLGGLAREKQVEVTSADGGRR
ncbi:hypothetical protein [Kiritimatiella glycovorans]|nr:hypothetical protein [Kiritimatiella glycovorans]